MVRPDRRERAPRHGTDHPLVVAQQDGAVLKQRAILPQLGAADHLSAFDHDLAPRRLRETGTRPHTNGASRWCQLGGNAETAERIPKHPVDLEVALTKGARAPPGTRRCTSAHGRATQPPAGRATDDIETEPLDSIGIVPTCRRLVPPEGEAEWIPAVETQPPFAGRGPFEQRLVDGHVRPAGTGDIDPEPGPERRGRLLRPLRLASSRITLHRRTHAHQIPISERTVDPADRGPDLVLAKSACRIGRALTRVGPRPVVADDLFQRVWRVREKIVLAIGAALLRFPGSPRGWK